MKKIEIQIHKYWKNFTYKLNQENIKTLEETISFQYNSETTLYEMFKYLNIIYKEVIYKFEEKNINKINYKRNIRNRYRIYNKNKFIYIFDLNSKVNSLIELFKLEKIEIYFSFFTEIGGKILDTNGMKFYMYSKEKGKHNLPHIHVKYKNEEVVISLDGKILAGKIKDKIQKNAVDIIINDKESFLLKWNELTDGEKFIFKNTELIRFDQYIE